MKFDVKKISSLLAQHQNNIDKKAINPIFSSIRFFSEEKQLKISSMDGERLLQHSTLIKCDQCNMFLPGYTVYELLRKSTAESFTIEDINEHYLIKVGDAEFKFAKYEQKNYPNWIDSYDTSLKLDVQEFVTGLKTVKWACSNDESRPFLNGVCLDAKDTTLNICATDGLRLAMYKVPIENNIQGTWIMNKKSINDLIKLFDTTKGCCVLRIGKNACVEFSTNEYNVIWKTLLVAGKFPQYEKIMPTEFLAKLELNINEFIQKLERIMIIANFNQPIVVLDLSSNDITLSSESSMFSGTDKIHGNYNGADMKIYFNARLLLEMLHNVNNDANNLEINMNGPHLPIFIKKENESKLDTIFMLAPLKRD